MNIQKGLCKPYLLIDIIFRINKKYNSPKWTNNLLEAFSYVMFDSKLDGLSEATHQEINKTIKELSVELKKE